jgi:hypothetical protein
MSQFSIRNRNLYQSLIASAPARFDCMARRSLRAGWTVAVIALGIFSLIGFAFAGPFDSIPVGSDRVILEQNVNLSANGGASNLFVPQQATVFFDIAVQPGKELLFMVITESQWQAMSSGERPEGSPILRTTASGVETKSVVLQRGTYSVAMIPNQGTTRVEFRARARY